MRIIVPNAAGGSADTITRMLAQELQRRLSQPFLIENRTGSNGIIALDHVAKSRPDGYTLITASVSQIVSNPLVYRSVPYDIDRDFLPVGMLWEYYNAATVAPSRVDAGSFEAFAAWAKQRRIEPIFGSYGIATSPHLLASLYLSRAGLEGVHVPYRGGVEIVTAMMRGDVHFTISDLATQLPFIQRGDLRALAVTGPKRWPALLNVPTVAELGLPYLEVTIWNGMMAPAGTPVAVLERLTEANAVIMADPAFQERVRLAGAMPMLPSPEAMRQRILAERPRWQEMVRISGAQPV
ncbi:Bug family tripartite tricarboxylate transporter substrate binding protein [Roseomonas sp. WA12]